MENFKRDHLILIGVVQFSSISQGTVHFSMIIIIINKLLDKILCVIFISYRSLESYGKSRFEYLLYFSIIPLNDFSLFFIFIV